MRQVRRVRCTVNLPNLRRGATVWIAWPPTDEIAGLIRATFLVLESAIVLVDDDNRVVEAVDEAAPPE